jgi:hypothetical protein
MTMLDPLAALDEDTTLDEDTREVVIQGRVRVGQKDSRMAGWNEFAVQENEWKNGKCHSGGLTVLTSGTLRLLKLSCGLLVRWRTIRLETTGQLGLEVRVSAFALDVAPGITISINERAKDKICTH